MTEPVRAIEQLLLRLSRLMEDNPSIQEIDINPVKVQARSRGAAALDARVIVSPRG